MKKNQMSLSVSVLMLAYNHEKFIAEAIQSVLAQRGDFSIKLIIGEDCSTDSTRAICEEFLTKFPDEIFLFPASENMGIQKNFIRTIQACCSADFIAFCEGDDCWTDPKKLSTQLDFLEANSHFDAHAHNVIKKNLMNGSEELFGAHVDQELEFSDLFNSWPFHTVSLVVRSEAIRNIPFENLPYFVSADRFVNRWLACNGRVYYAGEKTMAIYNRHEFGASQNSNYLALRYQEDQMLDFFSSYILPNRVTCFRLAKRNAIQDIALFSARKYGLSSHNRWVLLVDYWKYSDKCSFSFFYYMFLILFGSQFLRFRELFRKDAGRHIPL